MFFMVLSPEVKERVEPPLLPLWVLMAYSKVNLHGPYYFVAL